VSAQFRDSSLEHDTPVSFQIRPCIILSSIFPSHLTLSSLSGGGIRRPHKVECLQRSASTVVSPLGDHMRVILFCIYRPCNYAEPRKLWCHILPVFSLLSLKRKVRLMRSPVCLSVYLSACLYVPPNNFEPICRFL
jgi:hypothetical protein